MDSETKLLALVEEVTRRKVRRYTGLESALRTLHLFGTASGVLAYHGAGLANAVFAMGPVCVVEVRNEVRDRSLSSIPASMLTVQPCATYDPLRSTHASV